MTPEEVVHIAVAIDANYLPWCATLLRSCVLHQDDLPSYFHVLHDGSLSADDTTRLTRIAEEGGAAIEFHVVDASRLSGLPFVNRFGLVVWMRLLLPELLPHLSRVLYLDADTLVTESLAPLWRTPLDGFALAAVANIIEPDFRSHVVELGIVDPAGFFNSGVLLFNLDQIRMDKSVEELMAYAIENRDLLVWPDQDTLNAVYAGRWRPLHPRWNAQNSLWEWSKWAEQVFAPELVRDAVTAPAILHFEGPNQCKPWHYLCEHPWRRAYRRTLASTPWRHVRLEDRTPATMLIRLLPQPIRFRTYWRLLAWRKRRSARRASP